MRLLIAALAITAGRTVTLERREQMKRKFMLVGLVVAMTGSIIASNVRGAVVYTYTGGSYTSIQDDPLPKSTFTTKMLFQGWFSMDQAIPPLDSLHPIIGLVSDYRFNDGRTVFTPANSHFSNLQVVTGSSDNLPTEWQIQLDTPLTGGYIGETYAFSNRYRQGPNSQNDRAVLLYCPVSQCAGSDIGYSYTEGTWAFTVVPEPSSIRLLAAASVLVGWRSYRRHRTGRVQGQQNS
jgi:hypothetical protein